MIIILLIKKIANDNLCDLTLGYGIEQSANKNNMYKLLLGALVEHSFNDSEKSLTIDVKISGLFEFEDENITREEAERVLKVNGSSIIFPYIRGLVQMLTSYDCNNEKN